MDQIQNAFDQLPQDQLILGLFIIACLIIAIIGSSIANRYAYRRIMLRKMGTAVDFEKERRRRKRLRFFNLPKFKRINPMVVIILGAAIGFAYLNFIGESEDQQTGAPNILTGRVTHVRDGDTIVVGNTPIRFADLDCAELGTAAGERAKVRMQALSGGKTVTCDLTGRKSYDRMIGECDLNDGRNLSSVMIQVGFCGRWR